MFNNALNGKGGLSTLQKCHFKIVEQCPLFLRGYPMIFDKNLNILLSLIFFEKDLDIMFKPKCRFNKWGQCPVFLRG